MTRWGDRFDRCPKAWLRDEVGPLADLMEDAEVLRTQGLLPHAGGRLDQHPRFLEAVRVLELERTRFDEVLKRLGGKS